MLGDNRKSDTALLCSTKERARPSLHGHKGFSAHGRKVSTTKQPTEGKTMPKLKVSLGIGYANATREDVIDIEDEEWEACKTQDERETLIDEITKEWAWSYIDLAGWIVEDEEDEG